MKTFEEYFAAYGRIYRNDGSKEIDSGYEFNLSELIHSLDTTDLSCVWLETEHESSFVKVIFKKDESDEEFEERKLEMYNEYVRGEGARQQREFEEYKRLHVKYGENK